MNNIRNDKIRINNINHIRLKNKKRKNKLFRINCFSLALMTSLVMPITTLDTSNHKKNIPIGYIKIDTTEKVQKDDTLVAIAKKYYNDDIYPLYYQSLDNYIDEIAKINNVNRNNITPFQELIIPVIIAQNNIYLERIETINKQIKKLPLWIAYNIQVGDTISSLAYKGAGDIDEAYTISNEIIKYNNISDTNISAGNTINIINPQIGDLKKEIFKLKRSLNDSLKTNDNNLETIH